MAEMALEAALGRLIASQPLTVRTDLDPPP
jgi:hypothetical protein